MTTLDSRATVPMERLLELFAEQTQVHESLLEQIESSMTALREGRMDEFVDSCRRQQGLAQRSEQLESTRRDICGELTRQLGGSPHEVSDLDSLRAAAPPELGRRLDAAVHRLKPLVEAARERSAVLRRAVASMARHISGMVQAVHGSVQSTGTYERRGVLSRGSQLDYSIDVRS